MIMISLVIAGILLAAAGALVKGAKISTKFVMSSGKPLYGKLAGRLGEILFVAGIACIAAGMLNLYYG
jgi:hypothetical protein